jgi:replicative DNA helicase
MSKEQLTERICSILSKVPIKLMDDGDLSADQFKKIKTALKQIKNSPLTINNTMNSF